jgi:ribonuclease Z
MPSPDRAGPSTLVEMGGDRYLVDAGRGVVMRLAAAGTGPNALTAVLITHLHSDHVTDLGDVITTQWITTFEPTPLRIVGPPGTRGVVDRIVASLSLDIGYRLDHHADLDEPPLLEVTEVLDGPVELDSGCAISVAPTDHRPVAPTIGFRIEHGEGRDRRAVVLAGDTVPCEGLDRLAAGADALVHTAIRKDVIGAVAIERLRDVCDYHSSVEEAAATAVRAGCSTLVLTHYVPAFPPGGGDDWRELAAAHFAGRIELGDDLHRVVL